MGRQGGLDSPFLGKNEMSPSMFHCKHNIVLIIDAKQCPLHTAMPHAVPSHTALSYAPHAAPYAAPPTTTSKFSTCGKHWHCPLQGILCRSPFFFGQGNPLRGCHWATPASRIHPPTAVQQPSNTYLRVSHQTATMPEQSGCYQKTPLSATRVIL